MAEGFRVASAYVSVSPDTEGFAEKLQADVEEAVAGAEGKVRIGADTDEAKAGIDEIKADLDELSSTEARAKLGLDKDAFDESAEDARSRLEELGSLRADAELGLDKDDFDAEADDAEERIASLDGERAEPRLGLDDDEFKAKLDEDKAQLAAASSDSGGFEMPGGMLTYLGTGLAALAPGIGGAATGLGLLGGTGALAFGGIAKALDAAHQSALNVGMTSQQVAAQQFANATAVQQAQQSIVQATQQSAEDQVTSAASVRQALQGITQAQQGVQEADYSLSEAQYGLSQAWVQAREQITQLNDALADSKLNVQAASLAVQQAEYQQILTDQNAYSTSLDRQQASLAVAQAQQQLKDAQDSETASATAANLANKQGVAGSQTVIQAKQAVTQATYGQQNAQVAYQNAVRNAALAQTEAAYTQERDAEAVANAQLNLSNTIKEQQLQWASALSTENQAANQFAKDMTRLTPAGRGFVDAVLGLAPAFRGLETAAQNSVLPGMTVWLNGISKLLPVVQSGVSRMGQAMSQAFAQFGKQMQTAGFAQVLGGLITNGIKFANIVLPAFARFIQELAIAGAGKDAVLGLSNLLAGLADGLSNLVKGLTPFEGALSAVFSVLGSALSDLGGPLGQVIGSLATALAPAVQGLLPGFKALADALGSGLGIALRGTGPLLGVLAQIVSRLVISFAPLLPQIGALIAQLAQSLVPVLRALEPAIMSVAQITMQQAGPSMQMFSAVLTDVLPPLAKLVVAIAPLINIIARAALAVTQWGGDLNGVMIRGLKLAVEATVAAVAEWKAAWADLERASLYLWHNVMDPMWQGIVAGERGFVSAFQATWDRLEVIFKTPVNFLISTVYDKGIAALWNDVTGAIGLGSLKLPIIPALAAGGIVPGRDHGTDSQLVAMRPGEGVLQPGAVQAIGGPAAVHQLNSQHGDKPATAGGSLGKMAVKLPAREAARRVTERPALHLLGFQGGGVLGDVGGFFSHIVGGAIDLGKMVAAIATGNTSAFVNAASGMIGTRAAGDLGKIMTGIPKALVTDLAKALTGGAGGAFSTASMHVPGNVSTWITQGMQTAGVSGADWQSGLTIIAMHESGGNQGAVNTTDINAREGHPSAGLLQFIQPTFEQYAMRGYTSWMNPVDQVIADAWKRGYIMSRYGSIDNVPGVRAVRQGMPYVGYDTGGWLMPGGMVPSNTTGRPEAVLTPEESAAFVAIARRLTAQGTGTFAPVNQFIYNGPQAPTPEMRANQMRDLAMTLSGVSA